MAHFARVNSNNIVTDVVTIQDEHESDAEAYLNSVGFSGRWIQTSYNTKNGVHMLGGTPLRGNYAGVGYTYDSELDAFYPPDPSTFPGEYVLNTETYDWDLASE